MEKVKYFRFKPCHCCSRNTICKKYDSFQYSVIDGLICSTELPISSISEYKNGNLYGIDYSSCIAVKSLIFNDFENSNVNILELCSAPGSKMLYILDCLPESMVTGVDLRKDRLGVAKMLLRKYNHLNRAQLIAADASTCTVSVPCHYKTGQKYLQQLYHSPRHLNQSEFFEFDRVLVDSECTLDGKEYRVPKGKAKSSYSNEELFNLQKGILLNGFKHLKQSGILVYSTCSLNVHENECVVENLLSSCENAVLVVPPFWNNLNIDISIKYCTICNKSYKIGMRMDRYHLKTSGMFVAVVQRAQIFI